MNVEGKKHPCPDCNSCQWCSDDRCRLCLPSDQACRKKMSMAEQIARYEELNRLPSATCSGSLTDRGKGVGGEDGS